MDNIYQGIRHLLHGQYLWRDKTDDEWTGIGEPPVGKMRRKYSGS